MSVVVRACTVGLAFGLALVGLAPPAAATPVCTDGFHGGPPLAECGNRIFPEAALSQAYVQYRPNATGFREYADGLLFLAQKYPRWVQVFTLADYFHDPKAVTAGPDGKRAGEAGDTGDGQQIYVVRLTDRTVPDAEKQKLFFSCRCTATSGAGWRVACGPPRTSRWPPATRTRRSSTASRATSAAPGRSR